MVKKKGRQEVRRLKARGLVDLGATGLPLSGFEKSLQCDLWEEDED